MIMSDLRPKVYFKNISIYFASKKVCISYISSFRILHFKNMHKHVILNHQHKNIV
jgi:hypothetical protein